MCGLGSPMHLFKYLKRRHLDSFVKKGNIRIGTLYEYRDTEQYGNVIGDQEEGVHITKFNLPQGGEVDLRENSLEANFFRNFLPEKHKDIKNIVFKLEPGVHINLFSHSQDMYIYCTTSEFNLDVMRCFNCDACIEICDPHKFFHQISKKIRHKATFADLKKIIYKNKETTYKEPHTIHPAIIKDTAFSYQKEWRALWTPFQPQKLRPLYIDVPKAIRYCKFHTNF